MKRWLCLAALLCIAAPHIFANQITGIYVSGLTRTQPRVVKAPLQRFIGREAQYVDINEVYAIVAGLGVLEPLAIELLYDDYESGKMLSIIVRERWTIFGMPFFSVTSRGWIAGGGVADTNMFGLRTMFAVAGAYGPSEWFAMTMFIASPNAVGDFGGMVGGTFRASVREHTDQSGDNVLRRFDMIQISPSLGLSYSLTELITPGIRLSYYYISLRNRENSYNVQETGAQSFAIAPRIEMQHSTWDGFLLSENSAMLEYYFGIVFGQENVHRIRLRTSLNYTIVPGFRATARGGFFFSSQSATPFFESDPVSGINILSSSYSSRNQAGLSLGLERYLFRFSQGTLSMRPRIRPCTPTARCCGTSSTTGRPPRCSSISAGWPFRA